MKKRQNMEGNILLYDNENAENGVIFYIGSKT